MALQNFGEVGERACVTHTHVRAWGPFLPMSVLHALCPHMPMCGSQWHLPVVALRALASSAVSNPGRAYVWWPPACRPWDCVFGLVAPGMLPWRSRSVPGSCWWV